MLPASRTGRLGRKAKAAGSASPMGRASRTVPGPKAKEKVSVVRMLPASRTGRRARKAKAADSASPMVRAGRMVPAPKAKGKGSVVRMLPASRTGRLGRKAKAADSASPTGRASRTVPAPKAKAAGSASRMAGEGSPSIPASLSTRAPVARASRMAMAPVPCGGKRKRAKGAANPRNEGGPARAGVR